MPKIIVIPGSSREGSFNRKLAETISGQLNRLGAEASLLDIAEYELPIYDGDLEAQSGVPQAAKALAERIAEHQGVVLVHPEYNSSLTPLMKNMLDWMSRDVGVKVYQNRTFALAACSPGSLGGIRVLSHARDILISVGADAITPQLAVGPAGQAFDENGGLTNERTQGILQTLCETLIERAKRLT